MSEKEVKGSIQANKTIVIGNLGGETVTVSGGIQTETNNVTSNIQVGNTAITGSLDAKKITVSGGIKTGGGGGGVVPNYTGPYVVDAGYEAVILETTNRKCLDNITVNRLPENEIYIHSVDIDKDTGLLRATAAVTPGYNDGYLFDAFKEQLPVVAAVEIIPTEEEQIIATRGKFVTGTIKVEPIPSNYGKIGWNGAYLTVT